MATAMPRWRVNQCEISAINGAKAAELPTPITPYAMAYCHAAIARDRCWAATRTRRRAHSYDPRSCLAGGERVGRYRTAPTDVPVQMEPVDAKPTTPARGGWVNPPAGKA